MTTAASNTKRKRIRKSKYGERKFYAVRLELHDAERFEKKATAAALGLSEYLAQLVKADLDAEEHRDAA